MVDTNKNIVSYTNEITALKADFNVCSKELGVLMESGLVAPEKAQRVLDQTFACLSTHFGNYEKAQKIPSVRLWLEINLLVRPASQVLHKLHGHSKTDSVSAVRLSQTSIKLLKDFIDQAYAAPVAGKKSLDKNQDEQANSYKLPHFEL